jgi:menaquinone-dependent protoporphyrinogen oxidase
MWVLVTAATKYGATGEIAHAIGEVFSERGWDAMVVPPDQVKAVDSFDVVVPGSAVYAGHWRKPARELVDRSGDALAARPVWLFSSGPIGDPPSPRRTRWTSPRSCRPPRPASRRFRDWEEAKGWAAGIADAQRPDS